MQGRGGAWSLDTCFQCIFDACTLEIYNDRNYSVCLLLCFVYIRKIHENVPILLYHGKHWVVYSCSTGQWWLQANGSHVDELCNVMLKDYTEISSTIRLVGKLLLVTRQNHLLAMLGGVGPHSYMLEEMRPYTCQAKVYTYSPRSMSLVEF